jgi:hypothetical protein
MQRIQQQCSSMLASPWQIQRQHHSPAFAAEEPAQIESSASHAQNHMNASIPVAAQSLMISKDFNAQLWSVQA